MSTLTEVNSDAEFRQQLLDTSSSTLLVLNFHAPWAAPCAQMRSILTALASTYPPSSPPAISFLYLNAEELADISESYDVTAVPFLVLQRNGQVLESISGCDATKVRSAVEKHVSSGQANGSSSKPALPDALVPGEPAYNGEVKKDLSTYAPGPGDKKTAPAQTGAADLNSAEPQPPTDTEELNNRLAELVKAAPVMLFMKGTPSAPECGFSRQLVGILRQRGVRYGFFNILADEDVRQGLKVWADWPTFPQLWVGGELVGGLDIVKEELDSNPEFFDDYAIGKNQGGMAAPEAQATPAAA